MTASCFSLLLGSILALAPLAALADDGAPVDSDRVLHRLPLSAEGWTLAGENARLDLPVYLDAAATTRPAELQLALESAISVMPEASTLVATVNRQTIGRIGLGNQGAAPAAITIPPSVLRAGWNTLSLVASQRHRVDCSIDGTYELWTRIDPGHSGLKIAAPVTGADDLTAIAGLSPADNGTLPIRLRIVPKSDDDFAAGLRLAGLAARITGTEAPLVDYAPEAGTGAGLDIVYGRSAEIAALGLEPPAAGGLRLVPAHDGHRATLIALANNLGGVDAALGRLEDAANRVGPAPLRPVVVGHAPTSLTLSGLGRPSEQFSGHLWSERLHVRLPADTLIADYGSVTLRLSAGYAPGLAADNTLSMFVGGHLAAAIPLGNDSGAMIDNRRIELPLSAFRPGDNEIEFVAHTASAADSACAPRDQITGAARFLILNNTAIDLPKTARALRLPDLGATIANGRTAAVAGNGVRLALAERTAGNLAAAATLYAKMAVLADRLPDLDARMTLAGTSPAGAIVVGALDELPAELRQLAGLDIGLTRATAHNGNGSGDDLLTGSIASPDSAGQPAADPLVEEWRSRVGTPHNRWSELLTLVDTTIDEVARSLGLASTEAPPLPASASFVVSQGLDNSNEPVTLVAATDAATLNAGVTNLVTPQNWQLLAGSTLYLDSLSGKWQSRAPLRQTIVSTGPLDFGNLRMTTAAWFAMNTPIYAGLLALAGMLFGLMTYVTVRRHGHRTAP